MRIESRALALLSLLLLSGCANLGYYLQSVGGQLQVMGLARPIDTLLADPSTPPALKARLSYVEAVRDFASRQLALPDNGSYRSYADLKRPFVIWNVFAAPELSLELKEWCFPVAGCVSYRGYFSQADAEGYANDLQGQGYDVFVQGVPAYSTLGWFDDPVLNTFIYYPRTEVARLIFHELAHQVVYVDDDSVFNESFATAVETEAMGRWLAAHATAAERATYHEIQQRKRKFIALVLEYRHRLEILYASPSSESEKRKGKAQILAELKQDYARLKTAWGGFSGYDWWFARDLNNARIASVAAYTQLVPRFQALLAKYGGDLPRFYLAVKALARLPKAERLARLEQETAKPGSSLSSAAQSGALAQARR